MRKGKALLLTIVCAFTAIGLLTQGRLHADVGFLAGAVLFGGFWLYKFQRDFNIIAQARLEREAVSPKPSLPPMTSPGSRRLFVPQPIDK